MLLKYVNKFCLKHSSFIAYKPIGDYCRQLYLNTTLQWHVVLLKLLKCTGSLTNLKLCMNLPLLLRIFNGRLLYIYLFI